MLEVNIDLVNELGISLNGTKKDLSIEERRRIEVNEEICVLLCYIRYVFVLGKLYSLLRTVFINEIIRTITVRSHIGVGLAESTVLATTNTPFNIRNGEYREDEKE